MKMKKKLLVLLTALLLLLLTGCGSSGGAADSNAPASTNQSVSTDIIPEEAPAPSPEGGWEESGAYDVPADAGSGSALPANAKVILTGELELETKEFDAAVQAVDQLVEELGGWYESRTAYQGGRYRSVQSTVRVPAKNFTALLERAGEAAHKVRSSEDTQDVSEAYYDSEARLTTQRTKLDRLQTLLAQAESMEDIIALESAISETELQIEYLTGALRKYDSLVDYATVHLYLSEVYRLSTDEEIPLTFSQRLGAALSTGLQRGIDNLEDLTIAVARNWVTLLILAVVIALAAALLRRRKRNRAVPPPAAFPHRVKKAETPEDIADADGKKQPKD